MRIARRINNNLFLSLLIQYKVEIISFLLQSCLSNHIQVRYKTCTSVKYHRITQLLNSAKIYHKNIFYRYSGIYKRLCGIANSISDHIVQICIGSSQCRLRYLLNSNHLHTKLLCRFLFNFYLFFLEFFHLYVI